MQDDMDDGFGEVFKEETSEKPRCKLVGEDGNVFNLIGIVMRTLKSNGQAEKATEFWERAQQANSYDEVLVMMNDYVEVE